MDIDEIQRRLNVLRDEEIKKKEDRLNAAFNAYDEYLLARRFFSLPEHTDSGPPTEAQMNRIVKKYRNQLYAGLVPIEESPPDFYIQRRLKFDLTKIENARKIRDSALKLNVVTEQSKTNKSNKVASKSTSPTPQSAPTASPTGAANDSNFTENAETVESNKIEENRPKTAKEKAAELGKKIAGKLFGSKFIQSNNVSDSSGELSDSTSNNYNPIKPKTNSIADVVSNFNKKLEVSGEVDPDATVKNQNTSESERERAAEDAKVISLLDKIEANTRPGGAGASAAKGTKPEETKLGGLPGALLSLSSMFKQTGGSTSFLSGMISGLATLLPKLVIGFTKVIAILGTVLSIVGSFAAPILSAGLAKLGVNISSISSALNKAPNAATTIANAATPPTGPSTPNPAGSLASKIKSVTGTINSLGKLGAAGMLVSAGAVGYGVGGMIADTAPVKNATDKVTSFLTGGIADKKTPEAKAAIEKILTKAKETGQISKGQAAALQNQGVEIPKNVKIMDGTIKIEAKPIPVSSVETKPIKQEKVKPEDTKVPKIDKTKDSMSSEELTAAREKATKIALDKAVKSGEIDKKVADALTASGVKIPDNVRVLDEKRITAILDKNDAPTDSNMSISSNPTSDSNTAGKIEPKKVDDKDKVPSEIVNATKNEHGIWVAKENAKLTPTQISENKENAKKWALDKPKREAAENEKKQKEIAEVQLKKDTRELSGAKIDKNGYYDKGGFFGIGETKLTEYELNQNEINKAKLTGDDSKLSSIDKGRLADANSTKISEEQWKNPTGVTPINSPSIGNDANSLNAKPNVNTIPKLSSFPDSSTASDVEAKSSTASVTLSAAPVSQPVVVVAPTPAPTPQAAPTETPQAPLPMPPAVPAPSVLSKLAGMFK